jgi:hypothetical protein
MSLLIYAGLLYLGGVSIVLAVKPEFMFSPDGNWKEFGLGRSREKYTWFPFWLFAMIWAILSYAIVLMIMGTGTYSHDSIEPDQLVKSFQSKIKEVKPGYYLLHSAETMKKGVPKYIYLGPEAPNLIYNNTELD